MFRDPVKRCWPKKINETTATAIIVNAIEEYIGGEALDSEMEPGNPKTTVQAVKDLDALTEVLWNRYGRSGKWGELAHELERGLLAKKEWLENFDSFIILKERRQKHYDHDRSIGDEPVNEAKIV